MGTCVSSCIKCYGEEEANFVGNTKGVNLAADNKVSKGDLVLGTRGSVPTNGGSVNVGPFASRKPSLDGTVTSPKKKRSIRKYSNNSHYKSPSKHKKPIV